MGLRDLLFGKRQAPKPSAVEPTVYKRMMDPQPWFFSLLFAGVFMEAALSLTEAELDELVARLPTGLQDRARVWIKVYLAWALKVLVEEKYGREFAADALTQLKGLNQKIEKKIEHLDHITAAFDFWFPRFDAATNTHDAPEQIKTAPIQMLIAMALLTHGPEGPLFVEGGEGELNVRLAAALAKATQLKMEAYKRAVEIGAPLEEIR